MAVRAWDQLVGRLSGPFSFRFILQPLVAAALAVRAGFRDARLADAPFLASLRDDAARRRERLRSAWKDVGRVFVVAVVLDGVYQIAVLRSLYPLQLLAVSVMLALVPYAVLRGLATRCARHCIERSRGGAPGIV